MELFPGKPFQGRNLRRPPSFHPRLELIENRLAPTDTWLGLALGSYLFAAPNEISVAVVSSSSENSSAPLPASPGSFLPSNSSRQDLGCRLHLQQQETEGPSNRGSAASTPNGCGITWPLPWQGPIAGTLFLDPVPPSMPDSDSDDGQESVPADPFPEDDPQAEALEEKPIEEDEGPEDLSEVEAPILPADAPPVPLAESDEAIEPVEDGLDLPLLDDGTASQAGDGPTSPDPSSVGPDGAQPGDDVLPGSGESANPADADGAVPPAQDSCNNTEQDGTGDDEPGDEPGVPVTGGPPADDGGVPTGDEGGGYGAVPPDGPVRPPALLPGGGTDASDGQEGLGDPLGEGNSDSSSDPVSGGQGGAGPEGGTQPPADGAPSSGTLGELPPDSGVQPPDSISGGGVTDDDTPDLPPPPVTGGQTGALVAPNLIRLELGPSSLSVIVTWEYTGPVVAIFVVERALHDGNFEVIRTEQFIAQQSIYTYVDAAVARGQTYRYHVKAADPPEESAYSNERFIQVPG